MVILAVSALLSGCGASSPEMQFAGTSVGDGAATSSARTAEEGTLVPTSASLTTGPSAGEPSTTAYKIGPLDVIEISVFKVPDLSKIVQVSEVGTINYPLIGEVKAAGQTPRELEIMLTRKLGAKYLQNPQITVFLKEANSQRVTVEGAIKKPGFVSVQGGMTLLQVIALAGGLEASADDTILIFRTTHGKRTAARFDVADIRSGDAEDPAVAAGDLVVAGKSAIKEGFDTIVKALPIAGLFAAL